jgi:hypothetical protein
MLSQDVTLTLTPVAVEVVGARAGPGRLAVGAAPPLLKWRAPLHVWAKVELWTPPAIQHFSVRALVSGVSLPLKCVRLLVCGAVWAFPSRAPSCIAREGLEGGKPV